VRFRDALERESLLLYGFMRSCRAMTEEYDNAQGLLGDLAGLAGKALGSGSSGPDPKELITLMKDVSTIGKTFNLDLVKYPDTHKAGVDLNQKRADFAAHAETLRKHYIEKVDSGPKAMITSVPGVPGVMKTVLGFVFKPMDISLAMYFAMRAEYEDGIEKVCHDMTVDSIKRGSVNTFGVWFKDPVAPPPGAGPGGSTLPGFLGDAESTAKGAAKDVTDAVDDFLNIKETPEPGPGDPFLDQLFKIFDGTPDKSPPDKRLPDGALRARKKATEVLITAIQDTLKIKPLPGPLPRIVEELVKGVLELTKAIYSRAMAAGLEREINKESLFLIAREVLIAKLFAILFDLVSFLKTVKNAGVSLQGKSYGPGGLIDKAEEELNQLVGEHLEPILGIAMGHLGDRFNTIQKKAKEKGNLSMEVMYSALPELITLQVRNLLFPIFDLILEQLFAPVMNSLSMVTKPLGPVVGTARDIAGAGKEWTDKAKALKKFWDEGDQSKGKKGGLQMGTGGENISDYVGIVEAKPTDPFASAGGGGGGGYPGDMREEEKAVGSDSALAAAANLAGAALGGGPPKPEPPDTGAQRVTACTGKEATKAQLDQVKPDWVKIED
jgi:hypothetical protein